MANCLHDLKAKTPTIGMALRQTDHGANYFEV
jgi:hypothetical protein